MDERTNAIAAWLGAGSINLFGRPFAGKDTQGKKLAELLGAPLIGGGDILRSHNEPKEIEAILSSGGVVPHDFYLKLVLPYLSQEQFKGKPLILDAVGRSSGEEQTIISATAESGHPLKAVVVLQLSEEEVWKRFDAAPLEGDRGARSDDNKEVLKTRLQTYRDETMPVIEVYRTLGLLIEVDGTPSREEVDKEVIDALAAFATRGT
jgi:adenylate kinase